MSLLDHITGGIADKLNGSAGGHGNLLNAAMQLLNSPDVGGPGGLVEALAKQGQGDVVNSWLSSGKNLPISSDALLNVFDQEKIHQLAGSMGISIPSLLSGLTAVLPEMINKLSPGGMLPSNNEMGNALSQLARNYFHN